MTRSFTQVPPDSTGDKLAMRTQVVGADTVSEQGVFEMGLPTYRMVVDGVVPAANKYHWYLLNNAASGQSIRILRVSHVNLAVAAVTGVVNRFDLRRATGATPTGGSANTPLAMNTADPALANVTAYSGATGGITDGSILHPLILSSEEHTALTTDVDRITEQLGIPLPGPMNGGRHLTLRPAEGVGVKQVGAGAVSTFAWIIDFAVEAD